MNTSHGRYQVFIIHHNQNLLNDNEEYVGHCGSVFSRCHGGAAIATVAAHVRF
jgi:glycerol-3-phosphate acyltransferase PlsY